MDKTIGYNKDEIKNKFDDFYKDGKSNWSFDINNEMYLSKRKLVEPYIEEANSILDLGCAEGNFLASIIENKPKKVTIGVDISEVAIALAKEKNIYDELYVGFIDDTTLYTKNRNNFDLILLNEVLYYVDNYIETLEKILTLDGKYIFISLAMGPQFFSSKEANHIENSLKKYGYKQKNKVVYDMSSKFGIPIRFLSKAYEVLRGIKLKQTHKYIYLYEKMDT